MILLPTNARTQWSVYQRQQPYSQFLQSFAWGEFRISQGCPVQRYALVTPGGEWRVAIQLEYRKRRFGMGYWFAARGPIFSSVLSIGEKREIMKELCEELLKLPELKSRTLFWRFEPQSKLSEPEALLPLSFRRAHAMNPATSALLDLSPSEEGLQKNMHEKTRYNIRVAAKHGVTVRLANSESDLTTFLDLMEETARRDGFVQHSRAYLEATYRFLEKEGLAKIRVAEYQGKILCANLEISYGDTVTYLYGSSSSENRQVMAPFALQWSAIQEAKSKGAKYYDFGGANPQSKAMFYFKPQWEGITRFKKSWGAECVNFVGTWDLPFNGIIYRLAFWRDFFRS